MDFVVAKLPGAYGYIATGKDHHHGFNMSLKSLFEDLKKKDADFTYATPMELPLADNQREWTKRDNIYLNKLKYYHDKEAVELAMLMIQTQRACR